MASISVRQQNNTNLETMIQVVGGGGNVGKVLSPYSHHHHHHYHNHLNHQPFHVFQKTNANTSLSISSTLIESSSQNNHSIGHSVNKNSDANIHGDQLPKPKISTENTGDNATPRFLGKVNRYSSYHYDLLPEKIFDTDDEDEEDEDDEYIFLNGKDGLAFLNHHSKQKQKLSPEPKSNMEKGGDGPVISSDKFYSSSDDDSKPQTNQFIDDPVSTEPSEKESPLQPNINQSASENTCLPESSSNNKDHKIQGIQLKNNQLINMINQGTLVNSQQFFSVSPRNLSNNVVLPPMAKWDSVGETSKLTIIHCSKVPSSSPDEKVSRILPVVTVKKIKLIPLSNEIIRTTLSVQNLKAGNNNNNGINNNNKKPKILNEQSKNDRKKRLTKNQRLESCQKLRKQTWLQLLKEIQSRKDVILLNGQERRLRSKSVAVQCQQWTVHNRLKNH